MLTSDSIQPGFSLKLSASAKAYLKLGACAGLLAAGELLLKIGATAQPDSPMTHWATWIGIVFYVLNFVAWLEALKTIPVGIAFAVQSIVQLMVPISAWLFLHEQISSGRALGILLVFVGVFLAAAPSAVADERL
jgi:undecaprenyl phosphate-alpha-L-ara4N flippase subunit ArnE